MVSIYVDGKLHKTVSAAFVMTWKRPFQYFYWLQKGKIFLETDWSLSILWAEPDNIDNDGQPLMCSRKSE